MFLNLQVFAFEGQDMTFAVNVFLFLAFYIVTPVPAVVELFTSTVGRFLSRVSYLPSHIFLRRRRSFTLRKLYASLEKFLCFESSEISCKSRACICAVSDKHKPSFMLHFVHWLAYLIDSSKAIKVGGRQKPYKMWQAGISLADSPLTKSLAGKAREVIFKSMPFWLKTIQTTLRDGDSFRRLTSLIIGLKYLHQPLNFVLNILTLTWNV